MCEMTEAERLAAYDRMYADLLKERDKVLADMDKLRAAGRNRGTTYQQLLAQKGQAGANAPACFACGEGSPDGRPVPWAKGTGRLAGQHSI